MIETQKADKIVR